MRLKKYGLRIKDLFFAVVVSLMFFMSSNFVFGDEIEINEPLGLYKNVYEASYEKIANKESAGNTEVSKEAPFEENTKTENNDFVLNQKNFYFDNGDFFWFRRYAFKETVKDKKITSAVTFPGNSVEIRYVDPVTKQWVLTGDINKLKDVRTTLFINTEQVSAIISVPAVYKNLFTNNTLEILPEDETPLKITYSDGMYTVSFDFPQDTSKIGEIWCLQSKNKLIDWSNQKNYNYFKVHDLSVERRWSWDGYYFKTPSNYIPSGENILYRHPANYTGSSFARYGEGLAAFDLGFIMTNICLNNQNEEGFWETGPASQWLKADFQIGEGFYDTRFSTDFALNLVSAYKRYGFTPFIEGAVKYGEYFLRHAEKNHYEVGDGWLVEDYAPNGKAEAYKRTHVSLNHQVNEISFLFYLYNETKDVRFYEAAKIMLRGIENTKEKWVLPDGNLAYALMYNGTNNVMTDYPYLTYNDLFELKTILSSYGESNITVNYLMERKKEYMDKAGITEYRKE
ncbi:MAG: hypothetical protein HFE59_10030 [Clostridiales bacterium]|nr:hypothetical protein [Clostridiales bacterium]